MIPLQFISLIGALSFGSIAWSAAAWPPPAQHCELSGKSGEQDAISIYFEQNGGLLPVHREAAVSSETITPAQACTMRTLIEAADFFAIPSGSAEFPCFDCRQFILTVDAPGRCHTVYAYDGTISSMLRPLITWMEQFVDVPVPEDVRKMCVSHSGDRIPTLRDPL